MGTEENKLESGREGGREGGEWCYIPHSPALCHFTLKLDVSLSFVSLSLSVIFCLSRLVSLTFLFHCFTLLSLSGSEDPQLSISH